MQVPRQRILRKFAVVVATTPLAMVKSYGTSAALTAVQEQVSRIDPEIQVNDLDSLRQQIRVRRQHLAEQRVRVRIQVEAEVLEDLAGLEQEETCLEEGHRRRMETVRARALELASRIDELLKRQTWPVGRWINRVRAGWLDRNRRRSLDIPEQEHAQLRAEITHRRKRVLRIQQDPQAEAERRLAVDASRIRSLEEVAASPDARGAHGELAVIANLRTLPDSFVVLNDLRLTADSYIRFDGKPVQTAQVDHVVVGPTGVFLIETKTWSRAFADQGNYFDPYEQVGRAGLLCYCLLSDAHLAERVRNVIAAREKPRQSRHVGFTAVVAPDRLDGYIGSRRPELAPQQVDSVCRFLRRYVAPAVAM